MDFRLPIPKNWQDFESICHRLWSEIWNDPNAQKNGRQGQPQSGVDIFGTPIYSKTFCGIQCKDKDLQLGAILKSKELIMECKKATIFSPKISSFTLATTSPRDTTLQAKARQLTADEKFPFTVQVWSWDDIQSEIMYRPSILNNYYSGLSLPYEGQNSISLNRFSPKEQYYAYFSRPFIKNILSSQIKEFMISMGYELSDNAYNHGQATNFNIKVEEKKIIFRDNGTRFNPLLELDANTTSIRGNVGSFVLDTFLKKFKAFVEPKYYRKSINGIEENILEFNFSADIDPLDKKDFIELYVDWRQAGGREVANHLAASIPITTEIKEIIWTVTDDGYALSFVSGFIDSILRRLQSHQKLIVSVPRLALYTNIETWCADEKLVIQRR